MPPYVLIVEDDLSLRHLLHYFFKRQYRVRVATNGLEAKAVVAEELPDLIVSDVIMPGGSGLDLHKALGASEETSAVPFLFVSAVADQEAVLERLRPGDAFMRKPFDLNEVGARAAEMLART